LFGLRRLDAALFRPWVGCARLAFDSADAVAARDCKEWLLLAKPGKNGASSRSRKSGVQPPHSKNSSPLAPFLVSFNILLFELVLPVNPVDPVKRSF